MAKTVKVNKYGYPLTKYPTLDEAWHWFEHFYMVDETDPDKVYKCFTNDDKRIIWRETKQQSITRLEFSYGSWDDRSNLTYWPINGSCPVTLD